MVNGSTERSPRRCSPLPNCNSFAPEEAASRGNMPAHLTAEDFLRVVQDLTPMINAARNEVEQSRLLPPALVSALAEAGIFRMWLPRGLGGPELTIADFVRVVEALSYLDGSIGWCAGLGAAYSRFAGYLPEAVAMHIFADNVLAGSLAPTGRGTRVPGGYR